MVLWSLFIIVIPCCKAKSNPEIVFPQFLCLHIPFLVAQFFTDFLFCEVAFWSSSLALSIQRMFWLDNSGSLVSCRSAPTLIAGIVPCGVCVLYHLLHHSRGQLLIDHIFKVESSHLSLRMVLWKVLAYKNTQVKPLFSVIKQKYRVQFPKWKDKAWFSFCSLTLGYLKNNIKEKQGNLLFLALLWLLLG